MTTEPPSPHEIYTFFRTLRDSLPDENDYCDLVGTLLIPHNVMPLSETLENVLPYFRRSTNPSLFTNFQVFIRNAEQNEAFESTFMRVVEALDILEKVDDALNNNKRLFDGYLKALQLDNASASHDQVMNSLQKFLNEKCNARTQLRVRKVFAEEGAADELGLSDDVLAAAAAIIDDDALYIQILQTLQLNHRQNLSWEAVIVKIKKLVQDNKPSVWTGFYDFLDGVHRGVQVNAPAYYYPYPNTADYQADYEDGDYAAYCEQFEENQPVPREDEDTSTLLLEQKFASVSLDNDGIDAEPKQQPQQTVY